MTSLVIIGCKKNNEIIEPEKELLNKRGTAYSYRAPKWSHKTSELASHWFYHWGNEPREEIPTGMEYVPMFWGSGNVTDENIARLIELKNEGKINYILAFNEPDHERASNVTVDEAITLWPKLEQIGLPLVSPSVGQPGFDNPWLIEFMERAEELNYRVDFVGFHYYPNPNSTKFMERLTLTYEAFNKPIWITEFAVADWTATTDEENRHSEEEVLSFMQEVLTALDTTDWVYRYCWFDDSDSSRPPLASSRLFDTDGNITALGQYYAQHNPNLEIGPGTDTDYIPVLDENELITNGHFEGGSYEHDTSWDIWKYFPNGWDGYKADAAWLDDTEPNTGYYSGKLRNNSSALIQIITVEPGMTYTLKLFSKWQDGAIQMKVAIKDNATDTRFFLSDPLPTTSVWEESIFEVTIPEGTTEIKLILWNDGPVIYFDDISLIKNM